MKAEILETMKRKGTAPPNLTESDIDLDINYTSDIESRYIMNCSCTLNQQSLTYRQTKRKVIVFD